jgi:hypothetical protein
MTTWTPKTKQDETWAEEAGLVRVFDPHVFDHLPIFDTGRASGTWVERTRQPELWADR